MPDNDNDPGDKLRRLAARLSEESAKIGLVLQGFAYQPNLSGDGPDTVQAAFVLVGKLPDDDSPPPDQDAIDAAFERIMLADKQASQVTETRTALGDLERRLSEGGDILDDDD